ncbi:MAG: PrsW family glutamic-type intramembrane protease [Myxococcota bacterium]
MLQQLARLGFSTLVPVSAWRRDRPWTIASVQWFLFFTIFPLFLVAWTSLTGSEFGDVAYLYGVYFAMMWGLVLWLFVRPEKIGVLDVVRVSLFTSITGVFIVGVLYRLPYLSAVIAATREPELLVRLVSYVFGVGLLEELVKIVPVLWIFVRNREPGTIREITYLGCVSGFAFGVSEAVSYSVFFAQGVARGDLPLGAFVVVQLTRLITLPLLHAVFSGVAAQFVALGVETPPLRRALIVVGIGVAALIHGLYNTFSGTLAGFVLAIGAVLLFIAYVRSVEVMRIAVRATARELESPPG